MPDVKFKFTKAVNPEVGRLIRGEGYDWCHFTCEGEMRWVGNGRTGKKKQTRLRFFLKHAKTGEFESARNTWSDVETWEYADQPALE